MGFKNHDRRHEESLKGSKSQITLLMPANALIKAVTFDVAGTLIEPWPSVGHVYSEVAVAHGFEPIAPALLNEAFVRAWKTKGQFDYSPSAWRELVQMTFAEWIARPPADGMFDAFFHGLYRRFESAAAWRIFEDVFPTLAELKKLGLKLGVISNWDERLRPLLNNLDLSRQFDVLVLSIETGFAKPAPEIFRRAALLLDAPLETILHVGDNIAEDYYGALSAGMQAVSLSRQGAAAEGNYPAGAGPAGITLLSELPALLEKQADGVGRD